jgi:hypothetical protein
MKEEPPMSAKCRDKFLVQSTIITPDRENIQLTELWGVVEKEDKNAIHEQKIRCAFLPAATAPVPEEEEGNGGSDDKFSTVRGAPNGSSQAETYNPVLAASNAAGNTDGASTEKARNAVVAAGGAAAAGAGAAYYATKSAVVGGGANDSSRQETPLGEKSNSELQSEIKRLKAQVNELQRKSGQTATATGDAGVPVHIVAAVAFGVFAITYLFF